MRLGVLACSPETSAEEVARTLSLHAVSALVVTDADGYVVGLISRSDLVDAAFVPRWPRDWRGLVARHLMSAPVVSVRAETPLAEPVRLIRERRIHRVVVTVPEAGRERPIGILSVDGRVVRYAVRRSRGPGTRPRPT